MFSGHNVYVTAKGDTGEDFLAWQRSPDRSAASALVALVLTWMVGGYLILGMAELPHGATAVSGTEFLLAMAGPAALATAVCMKRRVRYWAGAILPGAIVGWILGCLTLLLVVALFALVA